LSFCKHTHDKREKLFLFYGCVDDPKGQVNPLTNGSSGSRNFVLPEMLGRARHKEEAPVSEHDLCLSTIFIVAFVAELEFSFGT
jgi:hypothetical protein